VALLKDSDRGRARADARLDRSGTTIERATGSGIQGSDVLVTASPPSPSALASPRRRDPLQRVTLSLWTHADGGLTPRTSPWPATSMRCSRRLRRDESCRALPESFRARFAGLEEQHVPAVPTTSYAAASAAARAPERLWRVRSSSEGGVVSPISSTAAYEGPPGAGPGPEWCGRRYSGVRVLGAGRYRAGVDLACAKGAH